MFLISEVRDVSEDVICASHSVHENYNAYLEQYQNDYTNYHSYIGYYNCWKKEGSKICEEEPESLDPKSNPLS